MPIIETRAYEWIEVLNKNRRGQLKFVYMLVDFFFFFFLWQGPRPPKGNVAPPLTISMGSIQITRICLYTCIFIYSVCALLLPENFSHTIPFFHNLCSIHKNLNSTSFSLLQCSLRDQIFTTNTKHKQFQSHSYKSICPDLTFHPQIKTL